MNKVMLRKVRKPAINSMHVYFESMCIALVLVLNQCAGCILDQPPEKSGDFRTIEKNVLKWHN